MNNELSKSYVINNFRINPEIYDAVQEEEEKIRPVFDIIDTVRDFNQYKVVRSMQVNKLRDFHFSASTGYGYNDSGRDTLEAVYASVFNTEDALVRPQIISGTHALTLSLFGLLRPGDELISAVGKPYDTLSPVIGSSKMATGSLKDWGINYTECPLQKDGSPNLSELYRKLNKNTKLVLIQRSKGYSLRPSIDIQSISNIIHTVKSFNKEIICMVDNCYGEFVDSNEPTDVGADVIAGSLIKNPGGGICPTGGYIAGKRQYIEMISNRLTAPGLGKDCGPTLGLNNHLFMGLFLSPHVVGESLKSAVLASAVSRKYGFEASPGPNDKRTDIVQSIVLNNPKTLISFCKGVQKAAPVDHDVEPIPWDMPGYDEKIIMAAGAFIQGSSIELSADGPLKEPYVAFFQGGLNYSHGKLGIMVAFQQLYSDGLLNPI
jgi:cystathionine beta-lyase family protein involved in aluminum resistance